MHFTDILDKKNVFLLEKMCQTFTTLQNLCLYFEKYRKKDNGAEIHTKVAKISLNLGKFWLKRKTFLSYA